MTFIAFDSLTDTNFYTCIFITKLIFCDRQVQFDSYKISCIFHPIVNSFFNCSWCLNSNVTFKIDLSVTAGSSWYLLCESCRNKYLKSSRNEKQANASSSYIISKTSCSPSTTLPLEPHIAMKQNALFLLELASSNDMNMDHQRRQSGSVLPSVSENITPPDYNGPFGPPPPFQCLQSLGISFSRDNNFYDHILTNYELEETFNTGGASSGHRVSNNTKK